MNVDHILGTFNSFQAAYLLVGGMNFLLRHAPVLTYDVDLWIEDSVANRSRCELALAALDAEWGRTDADWGPVKSMPAGWLASQGVFSLYTPHGPVDVFRSLDGPGDWQTAFQDSAVEQTAGGVPYQGLSDADMLKCQLALDPGIRKNDRIATLKSKLGLSP
jgi:hypothetical protein